MQTLRRIQAPVARILISLALALAVLAPVGHPPPVARAAGPYVVDTTADGPDSNIADGDCDNGSNQCTLRAAFDEASDDAGPTQITFDPSLDGATLVLSDTLGGIQWAGHNLTVSGGANTIAISGADFTSGQNLFDIGGNDNTLSDLTLQDSPAAGVRVGDIFGLGNGNDNHLESLIVIGSGSDGIEVYGGSQNGGLRNRITNSRIGTSDTSALACDANEGNGNGVFIRYPAIATDVTDNVIGCNSGSGVYITGGFGSPLATSLTNNRIGISDTGGDLGNGQAGVRIFSGASDVTIDQNTISGNGEQGIDIGSPAAHTFTITYNMIGTNAAGTLAVPNGMQGILVENVNNALARITDNLISGNAGAGVEIQNSGGVILALNRIGVNQAGTSALPNGGDGVALTAGAHDNLIGGTLGADGNIISGNTLNGVLLDGADTAMNTVSGNHIGANLAGDGALPNLQSGVQVSGGAHDNTIGGPSSFATRNVISGNQGDGVHLTGGATANHVDGNYIGLDTTGGAALPNGVAGVEILAAPGNFIGSPGAYAIQFISGNLYEGIYIANTAGTYIGETNRIGLVDALLLPIGNAREGIWLSDATNTVVIPLVIEANGLAGVAVVGASAGNLIAPTYNFYNGGLPIDLNNDGATQNDAGDSDTGPNTLLNYPVVTALAGSVVTGTACVSCTVFVYQAHGNPAAPGGGGALLGVTAADGLGQWIFSSLPAGLNRADISAVACDSTCAVSGNSSEMSPRPVLFLPVLFRN